MKGLIRQLLLEIGEDPEREGLRKTPERVEKAFRYLTSGYEKDVKKVLNGAVFMENYEGIIVIRDIDIFSLCEHHLLPFFGTCHIGYIPNGKIMGLSKFARLVEVFSRRLQVQERLTRQIADAINRELEPEGIGVIIEARHMCMMMRGVRKKDSVAVTSEFLGRFRDVSVRREFMDMICQGKRPSDLPSFRTD